MKAHEAVYERNGMEDGTKLSKEVIVVAADVRRAAIKADNAAEIIGDSGDTWELVSVTLRSDIVV